MDGQKPGSRWPIGLIALVGLVDLPRWLQIHVADIVDLPLRPGHVYLLFWTATLIQIVSIVISGFVADRFGARRLMTIGVVMWTACLAAIAVLTNVPLIVVLRYAATVAVALLFSASVLCIKQAFTDDRRARVLTALNIVSLVWLLGIPWLHRSTASETVTFVSMALAGALITAIWCLAMRRPADGMAALVASRTAPRRGRDVDDAVALFRRGRTWILVLVMAGYGLSYLTLYHMVPAFLQNMQLMPFEAQVTTLAPPLAVYVATMVVMSYLSDRQVVRTGRIGASRGVFIALGAICAAAIGLLPFASGMGEIALLCLVAFGQAMFSLVLPLYLDIVPSATIGRFSAISSAVTLMAATALFLIEGIIAGRTHSYGIFFYVVAGLSAATGILAWRLLPLIEPMGDGPDRAAEISAVFS